MDPITHTLVGASLAATRLGATTRCATAALVIGANLPDIDVLSYFAGPDAALGFRRGWTHGLPALAVLPAVLALLLYGWTSRRQPPPGGRSSSTPWLFGLSYLAALTHPALDWLNTYGMRWWMPFDGTWYYGDSVFIVDPWLWLLLGGGWLLGRRPSLRLGAAWALVAIPILLLAGRRAPEYLPTLGLVFGLLLLALLWRPAEPERRRRLAAAVAISAAALFVVAMLVVHQTTEATVRRQLAATGRHPIDALMVGPLPANPLAWEFVVESGGRLEHGTVSWLAGAELEWSGFDRPVARASPLWQQLQPSSEIEGFLGWVRFPWLLPLGEGPTQSSPTAVRIMVLDARYQRDPTPGFGAAVVEIAP